MKPHEYHSHLSVWMREYIADLVTDINPDMIWQRHTFINSPGWTIMHLITEGEFALAKLDAGYKYHIENARDFLTGSDGNATSDHTLSEMLPVFNQVYDRLDEEVTTKLSSLYLTAITDEELKGILKTELDYFLHILTTHLAMHCDALMKWRLASGMNSPYS